MLAIGFTGLVGATGIAFWVQQTDDHNSRQMTPTLEVQSRISTVTSTNARAETARCSNFAMPVRG